MNIKRFLNDYKRIVVVGGPNSGKTTLAKDVTDRPVYSTDDTKDEPWEEQPQIWLDSLKDQESFVLEGVQAARALRKGLEADLVIYLTQTKAETSPKQDALSKGIQTVMDSFNLNTPLVTETERGFTFDNGTTLFTFENNKLHSYEMKGDRNERSIPE